MMQLTKMSCPLRTFLKFILCIFKCLCLNPVVIHPNDEIKIHLFQQIIFILILSSILIGNLYTDYEEINFFSSTGIYEVLYVIVITRTILTSLYKCAEVTTATILIPRRLTKALRLILKLDADLPLNFNVWGLAILGVFILVAFSNDIYLALSYYSHFNRRTQVYIRIISEIRMAATCFLHCTMFAVGVMFLSFAYINFCFFGKILRILKRKDEWTSNGKIM